MLVILWLGGLIQHIYAHSHVTTIGNFPQTFNPIGRVAVLQHV